MPMELVGQKNNRENSPREVDEVMELRDTLKMSKACRGKKL